MLLPWLTLFDFRSIFANLVRPKEMDYKKKCEDFVILIPIFNNAKYLTNLDFLKKYGKKVILCTTNLETYEFYADLDRIRAEYGFNVVRTSFKKNVKNPWKIYHKTLLAHDYVLGQSLKALDAKYVIFLDADTKCETDLSYLAGTMEKLNYDLASVRVIPSKTESAAENLQYIEYNMAMKSRRVYPWLTSGAAMIGKREVLKRIMDKHSLFFNGGDIEIGKLANLMGFKVGHIPLTFYTDVPETFYKLFRQRFSWFCGAFRHSIINAHTNLFSHIYAVYFALIIFLMLPFKIYELFFHWYVFPFIFLFYLTINFVTNWEIRSKYMFAFPLYSLAQVIILPIFGIGKYVKTVFKTGNVGFIKVFYKKGYHPTKYAVNLLLITALILALTNITLVEHILGLNNIDLLSFIGVSFSSSNLLILIFNELKLFIMATSLFLFIFFGCKTIIYARENKIRYREIYKETLDKVSRKLALFVSCF